MSYIVTYKVTLLCEDPDIATTIDCNDDVFLLDVVEEQGIELQYSCYASTDSTCADKVIQGTLDHPEQTFLDDEQI